MDKKDIQQPHFVSGEGVHVDESYMLWIEEIKSRYKRAQIKAAVKVNAEQLLFNWQLGRDLVIRKAEERWGAGVVEQLSLDLKAAFPKSKGFSTTNLWNMKKWYLFYSQKAHAEKLQQLVGESQNTDNLTTKKLQQLGAEIQEAPGIIADGEAFPMPFSFVPWGHHIHIVTKCKNIDEALFYVRKTIEEGWSRQALDNCLHANLYKSQGGAISNFTEYLTPEQSRLAQEITKDSYDFGFIALPDEYEESELEDELMKTEQDNPTIGLLICKDKNQTEVKWAFKGIQTPMGVASYDNVRIQEIRNALPSEEELSKRLQLMSEKRK